MDPTRGIATPEVLMKLHILLFVLAVIGTIGGCKSDSGIVPSFDNNEILPLASGNTWMFLRTGIDSNGTIVDSSSLLMAVGQPDTFGREIVYPVSNFPFVFTQPGPLLLANKSNGLHNVIGRPHPLSPVFLHVLQFPTAVGDTVRFSGYTIRSGSLSESVAVHAGSFTCIRYDILQDNVAVARIFMVPDIGIVKSWQRYYGLSGLVDQLHSFQVQ